MRVLHNTSLEEEHRQLGLESNFLETQRLRRPRCATCSWTASATHSNMFAIVHPTEMAFRMMRRSSDRQTGWWAGGGWLVGD